jgi:nucleoid DNA-binding protein
MEHTMFKTDIVKRAAAETRLSQRIVSDVINASLRLIEQSLREGRTVTFPGFGTFYSRNLKEGQARDFKTGLLMTYPAREIAAFKPGAILKRAVRGERRDGVARRNQPKEQPEGAEPRKARASKQEKAIEGEPL